MLKSIPCCISRSHLKKGAKRRKQNSKHEIANGMKTTVVQANNNGLIFFRRNVFPTLFNHGAHLKLFEYECEYNAINQLCFPLHIPSSRFFVVLFFFAISWSSKFICDSIKVCYLCVCVTFFLFAIFRSNWFRFIFSFKSKINHVLYALCFCTERESCWMSMQKRNKMLFIMKSYFIFALKWNEMKEWRTRVLLMQLYLHRTSSFITDEWISLENAYNRFFFFQSLFNLFFYTRLLVTIECLYLALGLLVTVHFFFYSLFCPLLYSLYIFSHYWMTAVAIQHGHKIHLYICNTLKEKTYKQKMLQHFVRFKTC